MCINCNRKTKFFVVTLLLLLQSFSTYAKEFILGGKAGWNNLSNTENITKGKGRFGYECLELATNSFVFDEATDLLIDFENPENPISEGSYKIISNNMNNSTETLMEKSSGLSRNLGGISIMGQRGTYFGEEGLKGSFSIEFWLCPSVAENGETIINWESSKNVGGELVYQLLNCVFDGGHLNWTIINLFDSFISQRESGEIHLSGSSAVIPNVWSYHVLSFDSESGILEYLVNGITEDISYMTSNGFESGEVNLVMLGTPSRIEFCSEYTGKIDEIRILKRPYSPPDYQTAENAGSLGRMLYTPQGGRFESMPIEVSAGSTLNVLKAEVNIPEQTDIAFYVRSGDNFYEWESDYPEWIPVENGQPLDNISGKYYQVACELFPDGDGSASPKITQIALDFTELPEPLPPFTIKAEAGNGCVTVSWNYSVDDTAGGYYLYYGSRSGEYLGRMALEGNSPINVGNLTSYKLTGLQNGKIYYFAVAAWSGLDERIVGALSKEVFARPMAKYKK
ncbi:MAG: hypothetical protein K5829_13940 [Treponema sp.]|nr:hypothetical protein [Treponema sp.]